MCARHRHLSIYANGRPFWPAGGLHGAHSLLTGIIHCACMCLCVFGKNLPPKMRFKYFHDFLNFDAPILSGLYVSVNVLFCLCV